MSRKEYNKAYYEKNKERLQEYNKEKQRQLYSDEGARIKLLERNRKRYAERMIAYKQIKS
jgi:hypothetical protein